VDPQSIEKGLNRIDKDGDGFIDRSELKNEHGKLVCTTLSDSWSFPTLLRFKEALEYLGMASAQDAFCGIRLEENEHFVPGEVMDSLFKAFDSQPKVGGAGGVFLEANFLMQDKVRTNFISSLRSKKFDRVQIYKYLRIFSQPGTLLVVEDDSLGQIKEYFSHERFHRELKKLSPENYDFMMEVAKKLKKIRLPLTPAEKAITDRTFDNLRKQYGDKAEEVREHLDAKRLFSDVIHRSGPEEVYAHTATNPKYKHVEPYIQKTSPKAYALYEKIKARVLDLENYDSNLPPVTLDNG